MALKYQNGNFSSQTTVENLKYQGGSSPVVTIDQDGNVGIGGKPYPVPGATIQSLSGAGAVNVTTAITKFTSTGAGNALTLANGKYVGQRKTIVHFVKGASGTGVLTPATPSGFATATLSALGSTLTLEWSTVGWFIVANGGATIA